MIDPIGELAADRNQARALGDPNADLCFLATTDHRGEPQVRTLVLRDIVGQRLGIFLNSLSPKWSQLATGGYELLVYYPSVRRQYRLRGSLQAMDPVAVGASWRLRPEVAKHMDYYYLHHAPQGTPIASREELLGQLERLAAALPSTESLEAPPIAAGIDLIIDRVDRLTIGLPGDAHDRRLFLFADSGWTERLLVP